MVKMGEIRLCLLTIHAAAVQTGLAVLGYNNLERSGSQVGQQHDEGKLTLHNCQQGLFEIHNRIVVVLVFRCEKNEPNTWLEKAYNASSEETNLSLAPALGYSSSTTGYFSGCASKERSSGSFGFLKSGISQRHALGRGRYHTQVLYDLTSRRTISSEPRNPSPGLPCCSVRHRRLNSEP